MSKPAATTRKCVFLLTSGLGALALSACQAPMPSAVTNPPPTSPEVVGEFRPGSGYVKGYLDSKQLPDSLALLPSPPAKDSAQAASDLAIHRGTRSFRDTARWKMAAKDNVLKFPEAASTFSCTLDIPISQEATPHLNMLLRRTLLDAGLATYAAKDHYKRQRPFATLGESTCAPHEEAKLRTDGSFPSGHAALGWAWALVLTEIAPERSNALLARGRDFAQSRVICGVHWQSDVDAGREVGAATVARLHANEVFKAQLALAKAEIESARAKGLHSPLACKEETAAFVQGGTRTSP